MSDSTSTETGRTVTYLNVLDGRRHVLLDELSAEQAAGLMAGPFNDRRDSFHYLPGMRIEPIGYVHGESTDDDQRPAYGISSAAQAHSTDPTYVFRVGANVISTGRDSSPARNLDWAGAISYAEHLASTGRYRSIRVDLDTF